MTEPWSGGTRLTNIEMRGYFLPAPSRSPDHRDNNSDLMDKEIVKVRK